MRIITTHKVNGLNEAIEVIALGKPGSGGANYEYQLRLSLSNGEHVETLVLFQNGPIMTPADHNGLTNEALMAVLIDRMQGFCNGPYKCRENEIALTKLEEAMMWLQKRTRDRMARGVEGKLAP